MKKFFSLIALVGVFAACQKEDLKTAFSVEPAVATITAHAMFLDGTPLTSNVTYTFEGNDSGNGNTYTCTGSQYQSLTKSVTVTATWTGYNTECPDWALPHFTDSKTVNIDVLAGGQANYDVYFYLGVITDEDGYTYWIDNDETELEPKVFFLDKAMHEGHSFVPSEIPGLNVPEDCEEGWYIKNATEFILRGTVDYEIWSGAAAATDLTWYTEVTRPEFQKLYDELEVVKTPETLDFTVSAWADYTVFQVLESTWIDLDLYRTDENGVDEIFGSFSMIEYNGNAAMPYEIASQGHEAHYVPGHGVDDPAHSHGHGSSNAGGGIVMAD